MWKLSSLLSIFQTPQFNGILRYPLYSQKLPIRRELGNISIYYLCHMPSPPVLKTILHNSDVFFNSNKSLFIIIAILLVTYSCSDNIIIPNPSSTQSSTTEILLFNLAFYNRAPLLFFFSILLLKLLSISYNLQNQQLHYSLLV